MRLITLAMVCAFMLASASAASAATRGLDLGFFDYTFSSSQFYPPNPARRALWLDEARASGAGIVRIHVRWAEVAANRPSRAADPNDPAYRWATVDGAVQDATTRGLRVLLSIHDAPSWAEGPNRPRSAAQGSWMPNAPALGDFAEAAARRYPGVRRWQIWNEENLSLYLSPQWGRRRGRTVPVAAEHYRRMLNAAYAGLKRVNRANLVVVGGTAPYGDPPGGNRIRPVVFWKSVFQRRTSFDIFAHHPYSVGGPRRHALSSADVAVPDVWRLTRIVRAAVRRGTAVPRKRKPLWITEISWDSNPPDPNGVPAARHAAWLSDAFYVLWKQGAAAIFWFQVRDQDPAGGFDVTSQSGILMRSGEPKPAQQAFEFPVSCERLRGSRLRVWGKAPAAGRVELVRGGATVARLSVGPSRVFLKTVRGRAGVQARAGNQTSLRCVPA